MAFAAEVEVVWDEISPEPLEPAGAASQDPDETKRMAAVGAVGAWL